MYGQRRDGNGGGGGGGSGFLWGGLACCCAGAGCYLLGRSCAQSSNELRSARRFSRISDLSMTLAASSGYLPLVSLSGRVGSDTPIIGEQSGQEAAIVVNEVTQIFLKKQKSRKDVKEYIVVKKTQEKDGTEHVLLKKKENGDPEQWIRCSEEIYSKRKEVPWYLDDGTGRLEIVRDRSTDASVLCLASEDFEKQPRSCGCECSIKILGLKRTEWILPIGDKLTVVGQAVKDESGSILIQRPTNGGPFQVSRDSIDKVITKLGSDARHCKIWAVAFAASGALLLGIGGYAATC